ncbi:MAG TPA: histidine phosphatase family protein [Gemmatimonadales bacterium]|nr:histidine phosphatase family protein [Gemmatimonadales bacterium]
MKPTRLYLVRHGATTATAEERFSGATGVELSAEGRRQAEALAGRLRHDGIEAVYSSPSGRSLDTAHILAGPLGKVPIPRDGLREISHGHWEGLTRREVESRFPEEYAAYQADPYTSAPRGGETGVEVLARSLPVLREVVLAHPGGRALVVSHKATLRLLLSSLLGFDPRGYRDRLDQAPACLNVVDFRDPVRARLMLFNDVSHYAELPRQPGANLSGWWDPPGDPF